MSPVVRKRHNIEAGLVQAVAVMGADWNEHVQNADGHDGRVDDGVLEEAGVGEGGGKVDGGHDAGEAAREVGQVGGDAVGACGGGEDTQ